MEFKLKEIEFLEVINVQPSNISYIYIYVCVLCVNISCSEAAETIVLWLV